MNIIEALLGTLKPARYTQPLTIIERAEGTKRTDYYVEKKDNKWYVISPILGVIDHPFLCQEDAEDLAARKNHLRNVVRCEVQPQSFIALSRAQRRQLIEEAR